MKKIAFALLLTVFITGNAFAQLDPDQDGIGVYFDPCACVHCLDLAAQENHLGYVVITHPSSSDAGILGWEAKIWAEGPGVVAEWELMGGGINFATRADEFIVGLGEPLTNQYSYPSLVVAIVHLFIFDDETPINFFIDKVFFNSLPEVPQPVYLDGADVTHLIPLQQIQGGPGLPVAIINGNCDDVVATESTSFDGLKALYR